MIGLCIVSLAYLYVFLWYSVSLPFCVFVSLATVEYAWYYITCLYSYADEVHSLKSSKALHFFSCKLALNRFLGIYFIIFERHLAA